MQNKIKNYNDAQLFVLSNSLMSTVYSKVVNMNKDDKNMIGYKLVEYINEFTLCFSHSYKSTELEEKFNYSTKAKYYVESFEIQLKIVENLKLLTPKQMVTLVKPFGELMKHFMSWHNSLKTKIEKSSK